MNEKLNIQNLIDLLAEKHGMSRSNADSFVREFFQLIEESLENDNYVKVKGLGTFKLIQVDSRGSVDVNTGERIEIQEHTKVSFTPENNLKEVINRPFSHFETVILNENTVLEDVEVEVTEQPASNEVINEVITDGLASNADCVLVEKEDDCKKEDDTLKVDGSKKKEDDALKEDETNKADMDEKVVVVPEPVCDEPTKDADKSSLKFFIGIVIFIVVLCAGAVVFLYYPDLMDRYTNDSAVSDSLVVKPETLIAKVDTSVVKPDSTAMAVADNAVVNNVVTNKEEQSAPKATEMRPQPEARPKVETTPKAETRPRKEEVKPTSNPDTAKYIISGTQENYTIKEGETLRLVALKFYGTKALWSYLVKYNQDVIKNPDYVPVGTKIKIPKLSKAAP